MSVNFPRVNRPDLVDDACDRIVETVRVRRQAKGYPGNLDGFMLATPAIRLLRIVYGSAFRAAGAIFLIGLMQWLRHREPRWLFNWRHRAEIAEDERMGEEQRAEYLRILEADEESVE